MQTSEGRSTRINILAKEKNPCTIIPPNRASNKPANISPNSPFCGKMLTSGWLGTENIADGYLRMKKKENFIYHSTPVS